MADLHPVLAAARDPLGRPRFFPAGEHPAGARWREELAALEQAGLGECEAAAYARGWIARLERGEHEAKRLYLHSAGGR